MFIVGRNVGPEGYGYRYGYGYGYGLLPTCPIGVFVCLFDPFVVFESADASRSLQA